MNVTVVITLYIQTMSTGEAQKMHVFFCQRMKTTTFNPYYIKMVLFSQKTHHLHLMWAVS